jgi:RNA polymerase sigma-70 factor, ECF subfamily
MSRFTSNIPVHPPGRSVVDSHPRAKKHCETPDPLLMQGIRQGDEAALEALIQRYWKPLVRYALGFVDRVDAAEDLVQESFVRVWEARERWHETGSIRGYLYTIVRNLCLHERAGARVRERWASGEQSRPRFSPTPDDVLQEREVLRSLKAAIDKLPDRRREVFTLACLHGLTYREVANALGVAVPTVANQMSAALAELRETLQAVSDKTI